MNIEYVETCEGVKWNRVSEIFLCVGWGDRSPETLKTAFDKSTFVRFAYDGDSLVGFGRTVDDGHYYGWVVDLVVLPEYQRLGIGKTILEELQNDLEPFITTMLVAAPGLNGYYENLGWYKQSSAYIYPRSDKQIDVFSERR